MVWEEWCDGAESSTSIGHRCFPNGKHPMEAIQCWYIQCFLLTSKTIANFYTNCSWRIPCNIVRPWLFHSQFLLLKAPSPHSLTWIHNRCSSTGILYFEYFLTFFYFKIHYSRTIKICILFCFFFFLWIYNFG